MPVGRTRLLAVKYAGVAGVRARAALLVAVVGVLVGLALFPHGAGDAAVRATTVSVRDALWRVLLVALYVAAMLPGWRAIGLFVSTLTEVPIGAMAATAILAIAVEIADTIPQISRHPPVPVHH